MREDCNEQRRQGRSHDYISIHACARIAILLIWQGFGLVLFQFMHARGLQCLGLALIWTLADILIHACAKIATSAAQPVSAVFVYFDSCMREDCNKPRVSGGGASFILIHVCAKIATWPDGQHHDTRTF